MKIFKYLAALFFVSALALTGCASADADPPERSETRVPLTISPEPEAKAPLPSAKPEPVKATPPPPPPAPEPTPTPTPEETLGVIVYEVTGDHATSTVTYATLNGTNGYGMEQVGDTPLPFRVEVPLEAVGRYGTNIFSLNAMGDGTGTTLSCKISWLSSGEVLTEQTSTGPWSFVGCAK